MNKNIFKVACLSTALMTTAFASTKCLTPEDVCKNMRAHLSGDKNDFKVDEVADAVNAGKTTWAETFVRVAIELCLQSLNKIETEQAKALEIGNDIFADLIKESSSKGNDQLKKHDQIKPSSEYKTMTGVPLKIKTVKSDGSCMFHAFRVSIGEKELNKTLTREWLQTTLLSGLDSSNQFIREGVKNALKGEFYANFMKADSTANVRLMKIFLEGIVKSSDFERFSENEKNLILQLTTTYSEFFNNTKNDFLEVSADNASTHNNKMLESLSKKLDPLLEQATSAIDNPISYELVKSFIEQVICSNVDSDMRYFGTDPILEALAYATKKNVRLYLKETKPDLKTGLLLQAVWNPKDIDIDKNFSDANLILQSGHYDALVPIK